MGGSCLMEFATTTDMEEGVVEVLSGPLVYSSHLPLSMKFFVYPEWFSSYSREWCTVVFSVCSQCQLSFYGVVLLRKGLCNYTSVTRKESSNLFYILQLVLSVQYTYPQHTRISCFYQSVS